jgi:hypothetical protein
VKPIDHKRAMVEWVRNPERIARRLDGGQKPASSIVEDVDRHDT